MINAEKVFDVIAKSYERVEKRFEPLQSRAVENTKKYLNVGDTVLDFGSGTGKVAVNLAGYVKELEGVDISSKMVEIAKGKARERKIENVDFTKATIFDERYKRESFDVILSFTILHLLQDARKTVDRINELLKPGGLLISITPSLGERMAVSIRFLFFFFHLLTKTGLFPVVKRFRFSELEDLIAGGSFQIIETEMLYDGITSYFIAARKI